MVSSTIETFQQERKRLNELVLKYSGQTTKRFFSLDGQAYRDGALPARVRS